MKITTVALFCASLMVLAGCSSTKTNVDTGPVQARTFAFVTTPPRPVPSYAENRQHVHTMVQEAIIKNLAAKGVSRVQSGGDITVGYLVIVGNNATTTSLNEYFGYGPDATALVDMVHKQQTAGSNNPNYFEEGSLVIDILDGKSYKLLKRTGVQRKILRDLPMDTRAANIQEAVDVALRDLRISN